MHILTKMASSKVTVSGLSYCVFLVNQWIICITRGQNSCSATCKQRRRELTGEIRGHSDDPHTAYPLNITSKL